VKVVHILGAVLRGARLSLVVSSVQH